MVNPIGARLAWLGAGWKQDAQYLQSWRSHPLTYTPGQNIDENWNVDCYEVILGQDATGALFQRAAWLTLRNQFYPAQVMAAVTDFGIEKRAAQPGDRVVQRIRVLEWNQRPVLEVLTMNAITQVIDEPRKAGITYTTTAAHSEVGEWSATVEWRENGEVVLVIDVVSRTRPGASVFQRSFTRRLQLRAHQLSIQNFQARLRGEAQPTALPAFATQLPLLPVMMLAAAVVIFIGSYLGFSKRR